MTLPRRSSVAVSSSLVGLPSLVRGAGSSELRTVEGAGGVETGGAEDAADADGGS